MTSEPQSYVRSDLVCANCGSDRLGAIQRGIDNRLVAQCHDCGPKTSAIPDDDGTDKREKAINRAARDRKSQKAIHSALRPVVPRAEYRPKAKPQDAPSIGMFD